MNWTPTLPGPEKAGPPIQPESAAAAQRSS
jgi:hypothetical protein